VVLMDAGYGAYTDLRTNITALGLSYVAGIMPNVGVGARHWAAAAKGLVRLRATSKAVAA
jgi:SRSO17 transposase